MTDHYAEAMRFLRLADTLSLRRTRGGVVTDHYAEAMRLLRLADTISSILCREPYDTMWFGMGNAKADRLIAARNAHLQAAQVHATLAGIQA